MGEPAPRGRVAAGREAVRVREEEIPADGALVLPEDGVAVVRLGAELFALDLGCTHLGCLLLFLCVFEAYTGYLLPMDQLAYWATETGMELLRALPLGGAVRSLLVPDGVGGPLSLLQFYALHVVVIPIGVLGLSMLHFFVIRRQKGLLPYL